MNHSRFESYYRFSVWWLAQHLPSTGSFGTSILISMVLLIAWALFPFIVLPLRENPDAIPVFNMLHITPHAWAVVCWSCTGMFTLIGLMLLCRLLTIHYRMYYDRYNIPGIRW
jgi:hypothetical protein